MKMNETLRFSWGHIFAFLAIIFSGYLSFMGLVYFFGGQNFVLFLLVALFICMLLLALFIGIQLLKATSRKFARRIVWERILLGLSPILFLALMVPFSHFWTVNMKDREVTGKFKTAVNVAGEMFPAYDEYSTARIENYHHMIDSVVSRGHSSDLAALEMSDKDRDRRQIKITASMNTLTLQLLPPKYDSLKTNASRWIAGANKGASTWNIFLLGNLRNIKSAIQDWNQSLVSLSEPKLKTEKYKDILTVEPFNYPRLDEAVQGIDDIDSIYRTYEPPCVASIISLILVYLFLILPYLIQDRYSKSIYSLFGKKGTSLSFDGDGPGRSSAKKKDSSSGGNGGFQSFSF